MKDELRCKNCAYYAMTRAAKEATVWESEHDEQGECRFNVPTRNAGALSPWPLVRPTDWCRVGVWRTS